VVPGKRVLNVVPTGAPDKGMALARLTRRGGFERVLFVGDDDTDEDVFRRDLGVESVGVRVGRHSKSAARYYLRRQSDVDRLLERLWEERGRSGRSGAAGRSLSIHAQTRARIRSDFSS